eukprot:8080199-Alexandrium_andersonii.AAC.1
MNPHEGCTTLDANSLLAPGGDAGLRGGQSGRADQPPSVSGGAGDRPSGGVSLQGCTRADQPVVACASFDPA